MRRRFARLEAEQRGILPKSDALAPSLASFVEQTTNLRLDPWQQVLCARLERLKDEHGTRLLIHAAPQHGKSIIVSQRLPAWLLGLKPTERIRLACYNITHATRFGKIVLQLMQSPEYEALFPRSETRVPALVSSEEWSTDARRDLMDAQPSFKALGLVTGFVGTGADTLLIDDPYASPQDAASEVIRESVWTFWDASARVRITDEANVVVMFHRYHEDDLAGRLWQTGDWEMMRFPALADGDEQWPDPMGRPEGEKLSPRYSDAFYADQQMSGAIWLGQFQGRPTLPGGSFFKVGQLDIIDAEPANLTERVRAWDLAATAAGGDYTAGVLMGKDAEGRTTVLDVVRDRWGTDERNAVLRQVTAMDGPSVLVRLTQDPGQAGVDQAKYLTRMLPGHRIRVERASGAKETRADPFSSQVNVGNVRMVAAPWNRAYVEELRQFPLGLHDDVVDGSADAFNTLWPIQPKRPGWRGASGGMV